MSYKKVRAFLGGDGLKFGKYQIARYYDNHASFIKTGSCYLIYGRRGIGADYDNELRKISFDTKTLSITFESRGLDKKRFKKVGFCNITNKEFFNYVRNHVESLFGYLYDITPNNERTVFSMKKNEKGFTV